MAKKKIEESEEEELDDLDDDFSDLEDEELALPKIDKEEPEKEEEGAETPAVDFEGEEEDYDLLTDEQPELLIKDYKYIKPDIVKGVNEFDYELIMEGQSHGFCNILVKHLLLIEGVNIAAYKITNIDNPKIFLRIQEGYNVRDIIFKGIATLQEEVSSVEKVFAKLM